MHRQASHVSRSNSSPCDVLENSLSVEAQSQVVTTDSSPYAKCGKMAGNYLENLENHGVKSLNVFTMKGIYYDVRNHFGCAKNL